MTGDPIAHIHKVQCRAAYDEWMNNNTSTMMHQAVMHELTATARAKEVLKNAMNRRRQKMMYRSVMAQLATVSHMHRFEPAQHSTLQLAPITVRHGTQQVRLSNGGMMVNVGHFLRPGRQHVGFY